MLATFPNAWETFPLATTSKLLIDHLQSVLKDNINKLTVTELLSFHWICSQPQLAIPPLARIVGKELIADCNDVEKNNLSEFFLS